MTRGTKKFLKNLNGIFHRSSEQTCREVWDILTGLRGPDTQDSELKGATTSVIRHAIFGRDSKVNNRADVSSDYPYKAEKRAKGVSGHFGAHAERAFESLGLSWNNYNTPK